jgi:Tol biopolymer transport system component
VGDPTGVHRRRLTSDPGSVGTISWSPDGTRLVFENSGTIDVVDADGTGRRTLFRCDASCRGAAFPVWSPDGRQIAFTVAIVDPSAKPMGVTDRVEVMNADGTGVHALANVPFPAIPVAWQPLPG